MVKEKCLIAVRPSDSLTAADKDMAEEKRETDKMTLPPTAAELASIRKVLGAQKQAEQNATIVGLVCVTWTLFLILVKKRMPYVNIGLTAFLSCIYG